MLVSYQLVAAIPSLKREGRFGLVAKRSGSSRCGLELVPVGSVVEVAAAERKDLAEKLGLECHSFVAGPGEGTSPLRFELPKAQTSEAQHARVEEMLPVLAGVWFDSEAMFWREITDSRRILPRLDPLPDRTWHPVGVGRVQRKPPDTDGVPEQCVGAVYRFDHGERFGGLLARAARRSRGLRGLVRRVFKLRVESLFYYVTPAEITAGRTRSGIAISPMAELLLRSREELVQCS